MRTVVIAAGFWRRWRGEKGMEYVQIRKPGASCARKRRR
jgi:hypothetical protein